MGIVACMIRGDARSSAELQIQCCASGRWVGCAVLLLACAIASGSPPSHAPPSHAPHRDVSGQQATAATTVTRDHRRAALEPAALFPDNRAAQRMAQTSQSGTDRASVESLAAAISPDWAEWWTVDDVCTCLEISDGERAAVESLLAVRAQRRRETLAQLAQSKVAAQLREADTATGMAQSSTKPDLETRAELGRLAAHVVVPIMQELTRVDQDFADACALLGAREVGANDATSEALMQSMRCAVERLRCFDPALSRMKVVNTGVELTIHAAPLLALDASIRSLILAEVEAWQQRIASKIDAFNRNRLDLSRAAGARSELDRRLDRMTALHAAVVSSHADLVKTTVESARNIASIASQADPDAARAWLRTAYRAIAATHLTTTGGDAALDAAQRVAGEVDGPSAVSIEGLVALATTNTLECVELEGLLLDALIRLLTDRAELRSFLQQSGRAAELNQRRMVQSESVYQRLTVIVPSDSFAGVADAFARARSQSFVQLPVP